MTNLTDEQVRELISTDFENSYLVEASAGAGKTRCLVDRLVNLMLQKQVDPASVVAITFTNKAAQEFRERVENSLNKLQKNKGSLSLEQQNRLNFVADHLDQCYMGTIHSFCLQILREHPVESGLDLSIESMDEGQSQQFLDEFWYRFIQENENTDPGLLLLREKGKGPESLKDAFELMHQYRDLLPFQQCFTPQEMASNYHETLPGHLATIENDLWQEYDMVKNHDLIKLNDKNGKPVKTQHDRFEAIETYLKNPNKKAYQRAYAAEKAIISVLELQFKAEGILTAIEKKMKKTFTDRYSKNNKPAALFQLLEYYQKCQYYLLQTSLASIVNQAEAQRRQSGFLDFQDILITVQKLVHSSQRVRRMLKSKYQYFFVDEFQDTDPHQTEIIMQLIDLEARPASLFIVGDKKQSIYRFNRADVINFNNTKNQLKDQVRCVTLLKNFRTVPKLCHWFNETFGQMLPGEAEEGSQASYVQIDPHRQVEATDNNPELSSEMCLEGVFQYLFEEPVEEEQEAEKSKGKDDWAEKKMRYAEEEAKAVGQLVQQLRRMEVLETGNERIRILQPEEADKFPLAQRRPLAYKDIMAITGSTKGLAAYSRVFQSMGIPVSVDGETTLEDSWAAEELLKVLRAVENPYERLYTASALRSVLFGLSDQHLYDYSCISRNSFKRWNYLRQSITKKHPVTKTAQKHDYRLRKGQLTNWKQVQQVMDQLRRFHQWAQENTPITFLEKMVESLHLVPLAGIMEGSQPALHIFYQMIELLRKQEIKGEIQSVSDLSNKIKDYRIKFEKKQISLEQERDALRLMNLHKAKGLEAPVVILMHNMEKVNRKKAACHVKREEKDGILQSHVYHEIAYKDNYNRWVNLTPVSTDWEQYFREEERLLAEEHLRKVYVGFTRAENLLLLGVPVNADGQPPEVEEPVWLHHLAEKGLLENIPVLDVSSLPSSETLEEEKTFTAINHQENLKRVKAEKEKMAATTRIRRAYANPSTLAKRHTKGEKTILEVVLEQREKAFNSQQQEDTSLEEKLEAIYDKNLNKLLVSREWPFDPDLAAAFGENPQPRPTWKTLRQWLESQVAAVEEITRQDNPYSDLWGILVHGLMEKIVLHRQTLHPLAADAQKNHLEQLATEVLGAVLTEDIFQGKTFHRMYRQLMGLAAEETLEVMDTATALNRLLEKLTDTGQCFVNNQQLQRNTTVTNLWQEINQAQEVYPEMPFSVLVQQGHPLFDLWKDARAKKKDKDTDLASVEEVLFTGIMDLVYRHEGQWKIVDYKTNREKQGVDLDQVYASQLKAYKLAWKEMEGSEAESLIWKV